MADPILFLNSGRRALFMGSNKIHRAKSGKGKTCQTGRRLSMVKCKSSYIGVRDDMLSKEGWVDKTVVKLSMEFLNKDDKEINVAIRRATSTGRPLGVKDL